MLQQVETINKDTRIIKKNRMEILELKNTITQLKKSQTVQLMQSGRRKNQQI